MRVTVIALAALAAAPLAGCGRSNVRVEGTVVWADGTPAGELAGSVVQLEPPSNGVGARGVIGPDGTFRLSTEREGDGVVPGEYRVCVAENQAVLGETPEGEVIQAPPKMDPKFADWATSDLTASVKSGANTITLKVARAPKKR